MENGASHGAAAQYVGRLAPSPTGLLHLGHASTFWTAYERARGAAGVLLLRNEDLDPQRSKQEYVDAMLEDIAWLGIAWQPPMLSQSARLPAYRANLLRSGFEDRDLDGVPSDRLVDALVAHGDVDAVRARVEEHLRAGADQVALNVLVEPGRVPGDEWAQLAGLATALNAT